jgi:radical SAM superfamily enzyme YgiQ (UPF0313 family)
MKCAVYKKDLTEYWSSMTDNYQIYRPPAEAGSVIVQVAEGCPWNHCSFCGMYKCISYRPKPLAEIVHLIKSAGFQYPNARRIFLADADAMHLPFDFLKKILVLLNRYFPRLSRVNLYANGHSILAKSTVQLHELKQLKMNTLYMGLESGDDVLLETVRKRERAHDMINACIHAQDNGLKMSVMILIGLGGKSGSHDHVIRTAAALNEMQPRILSALRFVPVPHTTMLSNIINNRFELLSEYDEIRELRDILSRTELSKTVFRANHSSIAVPIEGRLPKDMEQILYKLNLLLLSNNLDRIHPSPVPMAM